MKDTQPPLMSPWNFHHPRQCGRVDNPVMLAGLMRLLGSPQLATAGCEVLRSDWHFKPTRFHRSILVQCAHPLNPVTRLKTKVAGTSVQPLRWRAMLEIGGRRPGHGGHLVMPSIRNLVLPRSRLAGCVCPHASFETKTRQVAGSGLWYGYTVGLCTGCLPPLCLSVG